MIFEHTYRLETEMIRVGNRARTYKTCTRGSAFLKKHSEGMGGDTKDIIATTVVSKAIGCFAKFGTQVS